MIRAQIIPDTTPQTVQPSRDRTLALIFGAVAALLIVAWISFQLFRDETASVPIASKDTSDVRPLPVEPPQASEPQSTGVSSTGASADEPPRATHEVLPAASRSALQTIRGTIRVVVRVSIDKQGKVIDVGSEEPGPSRYFERISLEAARQWTFTTASTDEPRTMRLRFRFTRDGVAAVTDPAL